MNQFSDAIDFIFHARESRTGGVQIGGPELWDLTLKHMELSLAALALACLVAVPLGLWLGHIGRGEFLAISISNAGRAVPTLALIAFFIAYLGIGFTNVMFALALLALPPILTNTYVGVRQVDRDTVDAARGMGMTGQQIVRRVELPLALPIVFGGVRTSAVNVVATAGIAPLAGVVTLGNPIINAQVYGDAGRLGASIVIAVLAVAADASFGLLQKAVTPKGLRPANRRMGTMGRWRTRALAGATTLLAAVALSACGDDKEETATSASQTTEAASGTIQKNDANASKTVTIGSKNFTEEFILGEIYAQALEAAGYNVKKELNLGSEQIALKAVKSGQVDAYPEYTGTALTSFFDVKAPDVPHDEDQAYEDAKAGFAKQNLAALPHTPFTDSNAVAMLKSKADELGIKTISDLKDKASTLKFSGTPECRQRPDCLVGLQDTYGLKFKSFTPVDPKLRHKVLENGQADVGIVFSTDGQIAQGKLVVLEDDQKLFPPYNVTLVFNGDKLNKLGKDVGKTVELVQAGLTTEAMQELNSRVDLDKQTPEKVAHDYLVESGYLK